MTRGKWILAGISLWLACTGLIAVMPLMRTWVIGDEAPRPAAPRGLAANDFYNRVYPRRAVQAVGPQPARSLADASRVTGFQVLAPTSLPAGFLLPDKVGLNTPAGYRMTIDVEAARTLLRTAGLPVEDLPRVGPSGGPGEALVTVQPVAGIDVQSGDAWFTLLQGRSPLAGVPTGIRPEALDRLGELGLRYLGMPAADAAALLPRLGWTWFLAFPPGRLDRAAPAQIHGIAGMELHSSTGPGAALIWENGGVIYAIYGGLPAENLRLIAESLR